ncbi:3458_t:CDS:2 [Acaulospora colombiana]|uniref:3458_t:CDS:1 n=1 Tax=Acaulospora colombiana TaxID=27376 RepID=A0ACA9LKJ3_9GLOM|nr:3458_t:CDS:2 [Acaulospora colombiana]
MSSLNADLQSTPPGIRMVELSEKKSLTISEEDTFYVLVSHQFNIFLPSPLAVESDLLVENIGKTVKVTSFSNYENKKSFFAPFTVFRSGIADFSRMDTDELVSFSNQLGTKLFPDRTVNSKRSEKTPKINRMDIRAIINSKDNYEDGNYSVVSSYIEEK